MKKVILNGCYGGWSISQKAIEEYKLRTGVALMPHCYEHRDDPVLVDIVEELGHAADGDYARLYIVDIPDGYRYFVCENDGNEIIQLCIDQAHLRKLVASGDADAVVHYVLGAR